jgi:hypothetical protein
MDNAVLSHSACLLFTSQRLAPATSILKASVQMISAGGHNSVPSKTRWSPQTAAEASTARTPTCRRHRGRLGLSVQAADADCVRASASVCCPGLRDGVCPRRRVDPAQSERTRQRHCVAVCCLSCRGRVCLQQRPKATSQIYLSRGWLPTCHMLV